MWSTPGRKATSLYEQSTLGIAPSSSMCLAASSPRSCCPIVNIFEHGTLCKYLLQERMPVAIFWRDSRSSQGEESAKFHISPCGHKDPVPMIQDGKMTSFRLGRTDGISAS